MFSSEGKQGLEASGTHLKNEGAIGLRDVPADSIDAVKITLRGKL
jgi:hypothetical protein